LLPKLLPVRARTTETKKNNLPGCSGQITHLSGVSFFFVGFVQLTARFLILGPRVRVTPGAISNQPLIPYPSSFTLAKVSTCYSNDFWFRSRWACASIFSSSVWRSSSETSSRLRSALTLCASVQATQSLGHKRTHPGGPRGRSCGARRRSGSKAERAVRFT
jgi:hypothetical protein